MKKKYLFFDIDGTLTTGGINGEIPQSAKDTLRQLKKNGHVVGIATGRPYALTTELVKELGMDTFICNGGNTVVYQNEKIINEPLNQEEVHQLIEECLNFDFPFCISQQHDFYFLMKDMSRLPKMEEDFILEFLKEDKTLDARHAENVKRLAIFIDETKQEKLSTFHDLVPQRYGKEYLMIEPSDKFKGIARLMEKLQAPIEDVVVFGDGENDMKMFEQAPFSIAVGNAVPELKKLADYVTDNSKDDGIYKACVHFGWI